MQGAVLEESMTWYRGGVGGEPVASEQGGAQWSGGVGCTHGTGRLPVCTRCAVSVGEGACLGVWCSVGACSHVLCSEGFCSPTYPHPYV